MKNFDFEFTLDKFKAVIKNPEEDLWYTAIIEVLPNYGITSAKRVNHFLAQICHESLDFTALKENMNYSAEGLNKVFPNRFPTVKSASHLHRNPEKIANSIYANRMGNGDTNSGDGWKYIGRGVIHITGKSNYAECSKYLYGDDRLLKNPDLLSEDKEVCIKSACWFWDKHDLNEYADKNDILTITKKINGGTNGINDRKDRYEKYMKIIK